MNRFFFPLLATLVVCMMIPRRALAQTGAALLRKLVLSLLVAAISVLAAAQQNEAPIYRFAGLPDGQFPNAGLVSDPSGNMYGTTHGGGNPGCRLSQGCGTVFELTPPRAPGELGTETILYEFPAGSSGAQPGTGLVRDESGNLYGIEQYGAGGVYELSPPSAPGGPWTYALLYMFTGQTDGYNPAASMILDAEGNLYGTTTGGGDLSCSYRGSIGCGTVYELSPPAVDGGTWSETVLYAFNGSLGDGVNPVSSLLFDPAGNLYGTTEDGGSQAGTVFKLSPPVGGSGAWTEKVIYNFTNNNGGGYYPEAGLVRDHLGNLYGTTYGNYGNVFELSPQTGGHWVEKTLYSFTGGSDVYRPTAPLIFGGAGTLYGTTSSGLSSAGSIFQLVLNTNGTWSETTLHEFPDRMGGKDGAAPVGGLIFGKGRFLYGTTEYGGSSHNFGTVFGVKP